MASFRIDRDGMSALEFDGVCLARVSTHRAWKHRWTELEIYRTEGGKYVSVSVGQSTQSGEDALRSARVCHTAQELVQSFISRSRGSLSQPALAVLDDAAAVDDAIDVALSAIEIEVEKIV